MSALAMMDAVSAGRALRVFRVAAVAAGSNVYEIDDWNGIAKHVTVRAGHQPIVISPALLAAAPELVDGLDASNVVVVSDDDRKVVDTVADAAVGVVSGELGVAETGSVLVSEHRLAERVITMLCRCVVQVVARDSIVESLDDVARWLSDRGNDAGFASLMTGPSRTADIERSLTIGVQGPSEVDVVVR